MYDTAVLEFPTGTLEKGTQKHCKKTPEPYIPEEEEEEASLTTFMEHRSITGTVFQFLRYISYICIYRASFRGAS